VCSVLATPGVPVFGQEDHVLQPWQTLTERGDLLRVELGRGDQHAALPETQPRLDGLRAEGAEERTEHRSVTKGPQRGDVELRDAAREDEHAIARAHPERREGVGEAGGLPLEVGVRQVAALAFLAEPAQRDLSGPRPARVSRDGFERDVEPPLPQTVEPPARLGPGEGATRLGPVGEVGRKRPHDPLFLDRFEAHRPAPMRAATSKG
jgi:hypothetical protein